MPATTARAFLPTAARALIARSRTGPRQGRWRPAARGGAAPPCEPARPAPQKPRQAIQRDQGAEFQPFPETRWATYDREIPEFKTLADPQWMAGKAGSRRARFIKELAPFLQLSPTPTGRAGQASQAVCLCIRRQLGGVMPASAADRVSSGLPLALGHLVPSCMSRGAP